MRYIARTTIKYFDDNGKPQGIKPGRPVPDQLVDEGLLAAGAVEEVVPDEDDDAPGPAPSEKPLAKQTKPELLATAQAEDVAVPEGATNAEILDLIQAKRNERDGAGA